MRKSGSKHRAVKSCCHHGHTHDSKSEAARCNELHVLQDAGVISRLTNQPKFTFSIDGRQLKHENGHVVGYKGDFQYFEDDKNVVEDVKAKRKIADSRDWPLRKAVFRALYPYIELREIRK